jgi:hypothetical protein
MNLDHWNEFVFDVHGINISLLYTERDNYNGDPVAMGAFPQTI